VVSSLGSFLGSTKKIKSGISQKTERGRRAGFGSRFQSVRATGGDAPWKSRDTIIIGHEARKKSREGCDER